MRLKCFHSDGTEMSDDYKPSSLDELSELLAELAEVKIPA